MGYMTINQILMEYKAYKKRYDKCTCVIKRRKMRQLMDVMLQDLEKYGVDTNELRGAI